TTLNGRPHRRHIGAFRPRRLCTRSDESRSAARLEHRKGAMRNIAPDRVEDSITMVNSLREIASVVIDNFIRPERSHISMVCCTRGRDHTSTDMLGKLDGKSRDAPRPALDQDCLVALELQGILDRTQSREPSEGLRGCIVMG